MLIIHTFLLVICQFDADPNTDYHFDADPDPTFHQERIRIRILASKYIYAQTLEKALK
jgi:hypothetical protein